MSVRRTDEWQTRGSLLASSRSDPGLICFAGFVGREEVLSTTTEGCVEGWAAVEKRFLSFFLQPDEYSSGR